MMQGELFDDHEEEELDLIEESLNEKYCIKCGENPLSDTSRSYCQQCDIEIRQERRDKYKAINSDPNKVWDPNYIKHCPWCKQDLNAEQNFSRKRTERDGYTPKCKNCEYARRQTFTAKFSSIKGGAKARGYDFTLTLEDTSGMLLDNCYYCGKPAQGEKVKLHGLDRVINDRGYHKDNVVTCCYECNKAKSVQTKEEFIEQAHRIANKHPLHNKKSNIECRKVYLENMQVGEIFQENFDYPVW